jgi:hypothetical protein
MKTIEFMSTIQDGYIKIPDIYRNELSPDVKVILMTKKDEKKQKSDLFPYLGIDMSGFKFDRAEANAR